MIRSSSFLGNLKFHRGVEEVEKKLQKKKTKKLNQFQLNQMLKRKFKINSLNRQKKKQRIKHTPVFFVIQII